MSPLGCLARYSVVDCGHRDLPQGGMVVLLPEGQLSNGFQVVVYDLHPSNVLLQVFAESKDEIALVLFGTDGTENALAGKDQYQNITVHRHLKLPDFDLLEDIESKIQPGSQQADCILFQPEKTLKKFPLVWETVIWFGEAL